MDQPKGETSGLTREDQIKALMPILRRYLPQIVEIATLYNKTYPVDTTPPEVVNAVSVVVPLRHFMVMSAVVSNLAILDIEREQAVAAEGALGKRSA